MSTIPLGADSRKRTATQILARPEAALGLSLAVAYQCAFAQALYRINRSATFQPTTNGMHAETLALHGGGRDLSEVN